MHISEARQSNFPVSINVLVCAPVYTLHQVFLKQERVVSSHGTGTVVKLLVVVANVSLPLGREEFIHVHFVTQRHHDQNACGGKETNVPVSKQKTHKPLWWDWWPGRKDPTPMGRVSFLGGSGEREKNLARRSYFLAHPMDLIRADCLLGWQSCHKDIFLRVLPFTKIFTEPWVSASCVLCSAEPNSPSQTCLGKQREFLHLLPSASF